jgi:hypothetical protein
MTDYEREALAQGWQNIHLQGLLASASFVLAALALWGDKLKRWLFAPHLKFFVDLRPPYCQRFPNGIWFRVRVSNESPTEAANVSIWLQEIYRGSETYPIRVEVTPIPLLWTHESGASIPVLNPHFSRYVDLGRLVPDGNAARFILCTVPEPDGGATHLAPGAYWIRLTVTASNARPCSAWFEFDVPAYQPATEEVGLTAVRLRNSNFTGPAD